MKRAILISIIFFVTINPFLSNAQSLQDRRADILFNNLAYSKAVSLYEILYKKHPQSGKYIQRLAYCYDKMLDYKKALLYYSYLVQIEQHQLIDYFEFAQLLRIDGRVEEAKNWLKNIFSLLLKINGRLINWKS